LRGGRAAGASGRRSSRDAEPVPIFGENNMQYRRLGRSGLQVSELSVGSWVTYHNQVDTGGAKEMLAAAMDAGVNFFDNAEVYALGRARR
jgi:hypothetical protein